MPTSDPFAEILQAIDEGRGEDALERLSHVGPQDATPEELGRTAALRYAALMLNDQEGAAEAHLRSTREQHSSNRDVLIPLGLQLAAAGHVELGEGVIRDLCEADPVNATAWYTLGTLLYDDGRPDDAMEALETALEHEPGLAEAHLYKAWCEESMSDWEKAVTSYQRYLELEPKDGNSWIGMAIALSEQGRFDEAYASYEQALAHEADPTTTHYNWAITAMRHGDDDRLLECTETLEEQSPEDWRSRAARAMLRESEGQIWPAWECVLEAVDMALDGDSQSEDGLESSAMSSALSFAYRHGLQEPVEPLVERIYQIRLFSPEVLAQLRGLDGTESEEAVCYYVYVEGRLHTHVVEDCGLEPRDQGYGFGRAYHVFANDEIEARRLALEFEGRINDGDSLEISEVEPISDPLKEFLGVAFCSGTLTYPVEA